MIRLVGFSISGIPGNARHESIWHPAAEQSARRTRTALRPEIPEDDDRLLALLDRAALDRSDEVVLGVERARLAGEAQPLLACDLGDCAAGREVAAQDAAGIDRRWGVAIRMLSAMDMATDGENGAHRR